MKEDMFVIRFHQIFTVLLLTFASTFSLGSEPNNHNESLESCEFKSTGSIEISYIALYQGSHRLSKSPYLVPIEIVLPGFQPSLHSIAEIERITQSLYEALNRDLEEAQKTGLCKDLEPFQV